MATKETSGAILDGIQPGDLLRVRLGSQFIITEVRRVGWHVDSVPKLYSKWSDVGLKVTKEKDRNDKPTGGE